MKIFNYEIMFGRNIFLDYYKIQHVFLIKLIEFMLTQIYLGVTLNSIPDQITILLANVQETQKFILDWFYNAFDNQESKIYNSHEINA